MNYNKISKSTEKAHHQGFQQLYYKNDSYIWPYIMDFLIFKEALAMRETNKFFSEIKTNRSILCLKDLHSFSFKQISNIIAENSIKTINLNHLSC